jgi:hypothetical protein
MKDEEGMSALDPAVRAGDFEIMLLVNSRPRKGISADRR